MSDNNFRNKKLVADNLERISAKELKGNISLNKNKEAEVIFESGSQINLSVRNTYVGGFVRVNQSNVLDESDNNSIGLSKVRCNFRGFRYWFLCPKCHKWKFVLYREKKEDKFACISCLNLTYNSRVKSSKCYIFQDKYDKTLKKINELEPIVKKKKYLGEVTKSFKRLEKLKSILTYFEGRLMIQSEKQRARNDDWMW